MQLGFEALRIFNDFVSRYMIPGMGLGEADLTNKSAHYLSDGETF